MIRSIFLIKNRINKNSGKHAVSSNSKFIIWKIKDRNNLLKMDKAEIPISKEEIEEIIIGKTKKPG